MIDFRVFCPIQQGNRIFPALKNDLPGGRLRSGIRIQFLSIKHAEFLQTIRFMPKPHPKFAAGGEFFYPAIQMRFFFGYASRPQTIHQQAYPVTCLKRIINPFYLQRHIKGLLSLFSAENPLY